jgi:group I intron endonuclease
MGIVYKITNTANCKIYVGQTIRTLEERLYSHFYDALIAKKNTKLYRAIRKYGKECFMIEVLEITDNLNEREKFFIESLNCIKKGYNTKIGGEGGPHHESTKKKISKANKKRVWTQEIKDNMSKALKAWHEERGFVPRSEDFKAKISEANRKRKMPLKTKEKFQEHNRKLMKPIVCITNGTEYPSIGAAARNLGINDGQLSQHLKGKHKHVKGYVFKYKESSK